MEQLPDLKQLSHADKDKLILELLTSIQQLKARITDLEGQIAKNSSNSGKPPSSDGLKKPSPKSQRQKTGRNSGGQTGHEGNGLQQSANPDFIEAHIATHCGKCQGSLEGVEPSGYESRQEFEIPPSKVEVTEHRGITTECPSCGHLNKGQFPSHLKQPVQYGARVNALLNYYSQEQLLPYKRTCAILRDIHQLSLSEGTLHNSLKRCHEGLSGFDADLKSMLVASPLNHFDESGLRVKKTLHWLHVTSTDNLTYYAIHSKRGCDAMDDIGILPNFKGHAVHDHWHPYFNYEGCSHSLCNAHHLRELTYHHEQYKQGWCLKLQLFLLQMNEEIIQRKARGETGLSTVELIARQRTYHRLLEAGLAEIPILPKAPKKRGRTKQHPTKNLWNRLSNNAPETLAFMLDFTVPFTNNQAEQDVRMNKVKQKVSGCFRSVKGAEMFCRVRSYLSTMKKQGVNALTALSAVFEGSPFPPIIEALDSS